MGKTSASNAEADDLCPGRHQAIQATKEVLPKTEQPAAVFGTKVHMALATGVTVGLELQELKVYEKCQQIETDLLKRYFGPDAGAALTKSWRHRRLWGVFGGFEHSGEMDSAYRHKGKALILDYKALYGDTPVSSRNKQLRDYAVLFWKNFALLTEVGVAIVQPAITMTPEICVYNAPEIERAEDEMTERIRRSNSENPPRIAGNVQCEHCDAKVLCKEYEIWVTSKLPVVGSFTEMPIHSWGSVQFQMFLEAAPIAQQWLDRAKFEAKRRLKEDPNAIPGYFLSDGGVMRDVVEPQTLFDRFTKLGGKLEDFMACVKIVLTPLEEKLRAITQLKGKGLDKAMDDLLAGIIVERPREGSIRKIKEKS